MLDYVQCHTLSLPEYLEVNLDFPFSGILHAPLAALWLRERASRLDLR